MTSFDNYGDIYRDILLCVWQNFVFWQKLCIFPLIPTYGDWMRYTIRTEQPRDFNTVENKTPEGECYRVSAMPSSEKLHSIE